MKRYFLLGVLVIGLILIHNPVWGGKWTPVGFSFLGDLQYPPKNYSIRGVRFNLSLSENENLTGLDFGVVNQVNSRLRGLQAGGMNYAPLAEGLQFGLVNSSFDMGGNAVVGAQVGLMNYTSNLHGIQAGGLISDGGNITGAQVSVISSGFPRMGIDKLEVQGVQMGGLTSFAGDVTGLQASLLGNWAFDDVRGMQIGFYNRAESLTGVQVGVINYCGNLTGLQVGAVNASDKHSLLLLRYSF